MIERTSEDTLRFERDMARIALGNLDTRRGRQLIEWIALNDDAGTRDDVEAIAGYVTVTMLSHVYGIDTAKIAQKIKQIRQEETSQG